MNNFDFIYNQYIKSNTYDVPSSLWHEIFFIIDKHINNHPFWKRDKMYENAFNDCVFIFTEKRILNKPLEDISKIIKNSLYIKSKKSVKPKHEIKIPLKKNNDYIDTYKSGLIWIHPSQRGI